MTTIELVDTTTRDGNQSLWGATGLTTPDVVSIAPTLDRVGHRALDFTSSTHMAVSVRFHHEDPWERIRLMSAAMPRTLLTFLTTGMRFISWEPAEEDVIRLALRLVVRNGIRRVQIADPMNDPRALAQIARIAKQEGAEEVVIGLTYSISEVHDDEHYATRAAAVAAMPDVDRLYLKDPGGLLTVDRVRELAPLFLGAFAGTAGRAAQPLHDRARAARLRRGRAARVRHAAHRGRAARQRHLAAGDRVDAAQPRGLRALAPSRPRRARCRVGALPPARDRARPAARRAGGVRRGLLPPSASGRGGDDDAPPARGDAPPGALRRVDRGDRARACRLRLSDRRHAVRAVPRHPGGDERDRRAPRRRALRRRSRRDRALLPRALRRAAGAAGAGVSPTGCSRCRARPSCAASSRSPSRARAPASASGSPTRSCCCG